MVFERKRIQLNLEVNNFEKTNKQIRYWIGPKLKKLPFCNYEIYISENSQINIQDYPYGKLKLKILRKENPNKGTNSIAFIFHLLAILKDAHIDFSIK